MLKHNPLYSSPPPQQQFQEFTNKSLILFQQQSRGKCQIQTALWVSPTPQKKTKPTSSMHLIQ